MKERPNPQAIANMERCYRLMKDPHSVLYVHTFSVMDGKEVLHYKYTPENFKQDYYIFSARWCVIGLKLKVHRLRLPNSMPAQATDAVEEAKDEILEEEVREISLPSCPLLE